MARRKKPVELRVRLYHGRDADLIDWIEGFNDQPYGAKSQAIKTALHRGIGEETTPRGDTQPVLDLGMVRQVVESAVASALASFGGAPTPTRSKDGVEDEETEALLEALGSSLVLDEE